jgi:polysaccharide export outer membrane protein
MRSRFFGVLLAVAAVTITASAQSPSNSDQSNQFKNLSQEEQDTLMQSVLGKTDSNGRKVDPKLSTPQTVRPKSDDEGSSDADAMDKYRAGKTRDGRTLRMPDQDPELRANDTILIDLTPVHLYDSNTSGNGNNGNNANNANNSNSASNDSNNSNQANVGNFYPYLNNRGAVVAPSPANAGANANAGAGASGNIAGNHGPTVDDFGRIESDYSRSKLEDRPETDEDKEKSDRKRQLVLRGNPYRLNRFGVLEVPGLPSIPLAGLTADEAGRRLSADPDMRDFIVKVTLLRLEAFDEDALKPFGYDLFKGSPSTFAPVSDIQVPADYSIGPGDVFDIQLYGNDPASYTLTVGRDGRINFPKLGPITVSGMSFDDARGVIEQRVTEQLVGSRASVTMGDLRSIRIFVLGEAEKPGSYTVSGLSTMTNALFVSGGVKKIGSLRNIQLKRHGKLVGVLDLYSLLLHGDTSNDQRLMPGDVIFIPPIGSTVSVYGAVQRPAIYELKNEKTAEQVVDVAGGLVPDADGKSAQLERIQPSRWRQLINVDLTANLGRSTELANGDKLRIPIIRPTLENSVELAGYVFRPGKFQFHAGLRLSDILQSFDELRPNADRHYVMIRREIPPEEKITVISADLDRALSARGTKADPPLQPRDQIVVFNLSASRERIVEPVIRDLELQASPEKPAQVVSIDGQVKAPGKYPLEPSMHVSDLIRAGGSLDDSAYGMEAELTRYEITSGNVRQTDLVEVDLAAIRRGDAGADLKLLPYDMLVIKIKPQWQEPGTIVVQGEVRFPGTYPIHRGETLSSILARAGGFTDLAFVDGAVFLREELKKREKEQLDILVDRMQRDLGALSLEAISLSAATANATGAANATQGLSIGNSLVAQLRQAKAVGRLVIDLNRIGKSKYGNSEDILVRDHDKLLIPKKTQEITILGEVQSPTSHVFHPGLTRDDYIAKSGGTTQLADPKRIYIIRANGDVISGQRVGWFRRSRSTEMRPGDTIIVPLDTERIRALPLWQAVTTIIYNLAVSVLAIRSV